MAESYEKAGVHLEDVYKRQGENLFKNIAGEKVQDIFTNAVNYFRKTK